MSNQYKYKIYDELFRTVHYSKGNTFDTSEDKIVFILHDAHNMFEKEHTSYGMSWELDKTLDKLGVSNYLAIGLNADEREGGRIAEFSYCEIAQKVKDNYPGATLFEPFGEKYVNELVNEFIPSIENKFSFDADKVKIIFIGSSMGGVINSLIAGMHPNKYYGYISMSPAYWANVPGIINGIKSREFSDNWYSDMGTDENSGDAADANDYMNYYLDINEIIKTKINRYKFIEIDGAVHNELAWSKRLPSAIKWILNKG